MPNSAQLTMLFNEVDFLDRFALAQRVGFTAIEYMFPYDWPKEQLAELLEVNGLIQILHNLPAGDWASGDRGIAAFPAAKASSRTVLKRLYPMPKPLSVRPSIALSD